ncbi:YmdB family metallophosphoesterase [Candidatus Saccharibacteria bacterium]|nr:YmdB family metallophosphoesterase [Candidatus Saccharibacteria bacterium]
MKILYIGDIVAKIGRRAVGQVLPKLKEERQIDFVIAQAENISTGNGITKKAIKEMKDAGVDFFSGGNHSFKKPEGVDMLNDPNEPIIRPANYPGKTPGRGWKIAETPFGNILIINVLGQTFNGPQLDHPLKVINAILEENKSQKLAATIVDFHADLSSEKVAIGFYLDGRVSGVVGSHTHVSTADARVLPSGTAHISDVGMTGPIDSVLGVKKEIILDRWLNQLPNKFDWPKTGIVQFSSVLVDVGSNAKATQIEQILIKTEIS